VLGVHPACNRGRSDDVIGGITNGIVKEFWRSYRRRGDHQEHQCLSYTGHVGIIGLGE
jgi:hypothetical protein